LFRVSDKLQLILSSFMVQVGRIGATLVMARLISPEDNGAYFLVLYVGGLATSLGDLCVPQSLVQVKDFSEQTLIDSALLLEGFIYFLYSLFTIGGGIYLAHTHHDSRLWKLAIMMAVTNFLAALYAVQLAALNRRLHFRAESRQNLILSFSSAGSGIAAALMGWGVYAIALQTFVGQLVANVAIQRVAAVKWPRQASWAAIKRFIMLGIPMSAASYVGNIEGSIVGLAINSVSGERGVGLWGKVVQVQQLFAQNLMVAFQRVAYPLLCRSVPNLPHLRRLFGRILIIMMFISLLCTAMLASNSRDMVRIVLGRKWADAVPALQAAAWAIPAGTLLMVGYILSMAVGNTKSIFRGVTINLIVFIPLIFIARPWGLLGMAICWSATRYLLAMAVLWPAARSIGAKLRDVWVEMAGLFVATAAAAIAMFTIVHFMRSHSVIFRLATSGSIGTLIYLGTTWLLHRDVIVSAVRMARGGSAFADEKGLSSTEEARVLVEPSATVSPDSPAFMLSATGTQTDVVLPPSSDNAPVEPEIL
jgi:polysaccharide transporter, PST family